MKQDENKQKEAYFGVFYKTIFLTVAFPFRASSLEPLLCLLLPQHVHHVKLDHQQPVDNVPVVVTGTATTTISCRVFVD